MWHAADDFVVNDGDFLNENWLFFNIVKIKVDAFMWLNHIKFISTRRKYQQNYGRLAIKRSSMCCQLWCVLKRSFRTGIFKNSLQVKIKAIFHYSNSVHVWILLFLSFCLALALKFRFAYFLFAFIFGKCTSSPHCIHVCKFRPKCETRQTCVGSVTIWFDGFMRYTHLKKREQNEHAMIESRGTHMDPLFVTWFFPRRRCSCKQ